MKWLLFILLTSLLNNVFSQEISGKWYGKLTQGPGGYNDLFDLELNLNQKKYIWGESLASYGNANKIRIGLSGRIVADSIRLAETIDMIQEDIVPWKWVACIKKYNLAYRKDGNFEYLEGTWTGVSKNNPENACIPGRVILSRSVSGLNLLLSELKDSIINTEQIAYQSPEPPILNFTTEFLKTIPKKVTEIKVYHSDLQILLLDYMKVDNDTVSVYLNRDLLVKNIRVTKRPTVINFKLDTRMELHEVLLYAENLGLVPPNTSELILVDGDSRHRIMIVSDKEKSATIYLRYNSQK
ncbi:hypothetical protein SAMN05421813_104122 [Daejeonella rubra]|uniref:Uncharacterized protein n=1 Tax=Daejeonella rubra TaxID=990371 RepID=A0A1G9PHC1_9SPHI|nr:hypothetical protein [Daejeonella rubra]SDL97871.1 hypothetical protein SAMN05421813_104122 [Daejeonella rubra]